MNKHMLKDYLTSHSNEMNYIFRWCEIYVLKKWDKTRVDKEGLPEVRKRETGNTMSRNGAKGGKCV